MSDADAPGFLACGCLMALLLLCAALFGLGFAIGNQVIAELLR